MKALITSIVSLAILIGSWGIFYNYSEGQLTHSIRICEEQVMPAVVNEDWTTASQIFEEEYARWHKYRKNALFFLDTQSVSEADSNFAKTLMYIKAEDVSNSSGELIALTEQLRFLHENEGLYLHNIL